MRIGGEVIMGGISYAGDEREGEVVEGRDGGLRA